MQPVHLTPEIVAEAALKAHAEGRLAAQAIHSGRTTRNFYVADTLPGVGCAVGVALPPENARQAVYPASRTPENVMTLSDPRAIDRIQELHDNWASGAANRRNEREQHFLEECRKYVTPAP